LGLHGSFFYVFHSGVIVLNFQKWISIIFYVNGWE